MGNQDNLLRLAGLYKTTSLTAKDKTEFEKYKKEIFQIIITDKNADIRRLVAEDINTPIEILEILSKDDAKKVVRAVAKNTSTSMNILANLLKYYDESVVEEAKKNIENKKKEANKDLLKLADLYKTTSLTAKDKIEFEKYKKEIFEILITDKNADIRRLVAEDINTPIEILEILSTDDAKKVVRAVAKNTSTSMNILEKLLKYYDESVVEEAKKNIENKKKEALNPPKKIIENPEEKIISKLTELYKTASLGKNESADFEKYKNKIFEILITDKDVNTRKLVADDINTPIDFLIKLSKDKEERVRRGVAKNKSTTIEILTELTNDGEKSVVDEAVKNLRERKIKSGILLKTLESHTHWITSLVITFDGKNIISGSDDKTIKIWDFEGNCLKTLEDHKNWISSVAITSDGKNIISGSGDKTIKIWDFNGNCLKTLKGHKDSVWSLAITPDGKNIISGSRDKTIKIWDFEGNCLKTLEGHKDSVPSLAITPDGKNIISRSYDNTIKIWDFAGNCLKTLEGHKNSINSLAITPNGKNIISGSKDETIKIWDLNGTCLQTLEGHNDSVLSLAITPNGKNIISESRDNTIKIWDFAGNCLQTLEGHEYTVSSLAITPDGKNIISGSKDNSIKIWDLDGNCLKTLEGHKADILSLAITSDGKNIISGSGDKTIKIWDLENINFNEEALLEEDIPDILNLYKTSSLRGISLVKFENNKYKLFKILVNDKDAKVRKKVAEDNNTPVEILEFIVNNEINKEIVLSAINNSIYLFEEEDSVVFMLNTGLHMGAYYIETDKSKYLTINQDPFANVFKWERISIGYDRDLWITDYLAEFNKYTKVTEELLKILALIVVKISSNEKLLKNYFTNVTEYPIFHPTILKKVIKMLENLSNALGNDRTKPLIQFLTDNQQENKKAHSSLQLNISYVRKITTIKELKEAYPNYDLNIFRQYTYLYTNKFGNEIGKNQKSIYLGDIVEIINKLDEKERVTFKVKLNGTKELIHYRNVPEIAAKVKEYFDDFGAIEDEEEIPSESQIISKLAELYKTASLGKNESADFEKYKNKIFEILITDKDVNTRKLVADDVNAPIEFLTKLSKDKEERVRRGIAKNKSTTIEVLTELTNDGEKSVVDEAVKNLRERKIKSGILLKTLESHTSSVDSLAITPDGKNIISGSDDETIKIWDLTGNCLKTLEGHENYVNSLTITPNGKNIISGSRDETIKIWDFAGNCLKTLEGHKDSVLSLVITQNGKNIISGSEDNTIKIWDFEGNCLKTLEGHKNGVSSLAITPDGKNIISGSGDTTIKIWDFAGNCLKTLKVHKYSVSSLVITPDGKNIISGSDDEIIKIWDFAGNCLKTLKGHENGVSSLAITPDGKNIISGSYEEIKIWDFEGNCLKTLEGHTKSVSSIAITPNGKNIISGSIDNTIKIWDLETLKKDFEDINDEEFEDDLEDIEDEEYEDDIEDLEDEEFEDDLEDIENEEDETITFIDSESQIISKLTELYKTVSLGKNESADFEKYKNKIFEILITDKDVNTRKLVADDINTPIDFLIKLSKDKEERVRRGIAKNKSTTIEVLTELTNDGEKSVVDEAVKNLKSKKTKTEIKPNEKTEEPKKEEIKKEETTVKTPIPEPKKELKIDYNLFLEGILLYKSKDYLNSINVLKSFDNAYSYIYLADSYKNNNDLVNCKKYFKIALEKGLLKIKDKYLSEPYYIYAKYLFEIENNYEASLESIITALENEPNNIDYIKLSVEIYKALNNEKEIIQMLKKVYFLSKEHEDFKELFSQYDIADLYLKDVRHNKDFKIELSKQAINDLILIMLHLKLICITNKKVISIIKDINCSFEENNYIEEQFGDNPVYLEKYLQNHKIYEKVTLNLLKTLLYYMYLNESIIDSYLLDYKNYPIIKPSILNYLIEILKQLEITNKDFYPLKRNLLYNISKNKENYFNYKVIKQNINAQNYKEIYKYFPKTIDNNEIPDNV